ncbi:MAG: molybdopterin synthase sulfur carrier subunit [Paracoccaceae bacterium]|jgi:molybdopterin synthase sulfur carrier subunit
MQILYFAWLRERIGVAEETFTSSALTVHDLVDELRTRDQRYGAAFADISSVRVALDQRLGSFDDPIAGVREVAFFPPMTGG